MAVKIGDVTIRIGATTKQLEADLKKADRALQASSRKFTDAGQKMSLAFTAPFAGLATISVIKFDAQIQAIGQVEAALASTGAVAGKTSEELQKSASALQEITTFGDEDILRGVTAQLLTFTNVAGEQFDKAQLAALNLSTRLGTDLTSQTIQLGKALNDPIKGITALGRAGIQFSDEQKETIKRLAETNQIAKAQDIILKELETQFGGSAEAAAKLGSGPIKQLNNQFGDLLEEFGKIISEAIIPFVARLKNVVTAFQSMDGATKKTIVTVAALVATIGPLLFITGKLISVYAGIVGPIVKMIASLTAQAAASGAAAAATTGAAVTTVAFGTALKATLLVAAPYVAIIGAIAGGIYLLYKNYQSAEKAGNLLADVQNESAKSMAAEKAQTQALIGVINDQTKSINDKKGALEELKKINPDYFGDLDIERDGIKKINDQYTDYIGNITKAAKAKIGGEKLEQLLKNEITSLNQINEIEKKITDQTLKLGKARQNTSALGASTGSMGSYSAVLAIEQQITNLKNQKQALQDSQNQIKNNIKETENFIIANTNFNKTIDDGGGGGGGISDNLKKQLQEISNELANVDKLFKAGLITGSEASEQKLKLLEDRLKLLVTNGFNPTSQAVLGTKNEIKNLQNELGQQFASVDIVDNLSKQFTNLDNQLNAGTITSFQATSEKVQLLTDEMQRLKDEGVSPASEEFQRLTKIYDNLANASNRIDISVNTLIDNFKSAGLALNSIEKTALDELSSKISEVQNKSSKGLIGSTDASIERVDAIKNALKTLTEQNLGESNLAKELQNQLVNLNPFIEQVGFLKSEMQRLKDEGISPTSEEFQKLNKSYIELGEEQDNYVKNIAALITGVKDLSDPFNEIQTDTLTELSKQITIIQEKTAAGLISQSDADVERINAIKTALNSLIEQGLGGTDAAAKLQEQLKGAESSVKTTYTNIFDFLGNKIASLPGIAEKLGENVQTLGPKIGKAFEGAVAAVQQVFSTFGAFFDMQEAKIDQFEEKEKERIANSIMGEEAKEAALANLNEKVLKKRKALARKQAALDKASALFSATIAGANAVLQALAVPLIGPVLAKITAGLVAAQLAFIAATPLPSLAIGTDLVKSDGLAMLHKGEAVVPADVAKGGFNGSGGMAQVSGRIQGTDIILVSDYAMNFKNRIR